MKVYGNDKLEVGQCLLNIARCYNYFDMFHESYNYNNKGIEIIAKTLGEEVAIQYYLKVYICIKKKDHNEVKEMLENMLKFNNCENKKIKQFLLNKIADCSREASDNTNE